MTPPVHAFVRVPNGVNLAVCPVCLFVAPIMISRGGEIAVLLPIDEAKCDGRGSASHYPTDPRPGAMQLTKGVTQ